IFGISPSGKLLLELTAFLACPVVDLVGKQHITCRVGFFLSKGRPGGKGGVKHGKPLLKKETEINQSPNAATRPLTNSRSGAGSSDRPAAMGHRRWPRLTAALAQAPL